MAAVKCFYCKNLIDRDKEIFARLHYGSVYRYAHKQCYDDAVAAGKEKRECDIINPTQTVICAYCKKPMNKTDFDCQPINSKKTAFAHFLCIQKEKDRVKTPEEELDIYIMKLFSIDYVPPLIQRQKQSFVQKDNLTYSGIKGSLKYFYEIKQNKIDLDNPTIGIVPYIYNEAKEYYKKLALVKMKNDGKDLTYDNKIVELVIQKPKRAVTQKSFFTFLDEEVLNE